MNINRIIEQLPAQNQKDSIRNYDRCVVLAGPGSGKTYRLVLKCAYLLGQEVHEPQAVMCITYMNDAVLEIQERLENYGFIDDQRIFIETVHKFCITAIILPFKDMFLSHWPYEFRLANENQRIEAIIEAYNRALGSSISEKEAKTKFSLIRAFREQKFLDQANILQNKFALVVEEYIAALRLRGLVDFDDVAIESCSLVINKPEVRRYLVSRFPWLIIDEYQDLGQIFNKLILSLIEETNINFFIVGDSNQSILGFQGAVPQYLINLANSNKGHLIKLPISWRCMPNVIDTANLLLPENADPIKAMRPGSEKSRVNINYCPNGFTSQLDNIVREIVSLQSDEIPLGEIAVLCRTRNTVQSIADVFEDQKIPYSGNADGRYQRTPLTRWIENLAKWTIHGWQTGQPKYQSIYRQYKKLQSYLTADLNRGKTELQKESLFVNALKNSGVPETLASEWLTNITRQLTLDRIAEAASLTEPYIAESFFELAEMLSEGKLKNMTVRGLALCGRSANSVFLSTLHSSKGLEFDAVIIPELEKGRLPDFRAKTMDALEEERRLLFVGITRAKQSVLLLYSGY